MKKIKWENIIFIILLIYSVLAIAHHNFNVMTILEIPVYFTMAIMVRETIKVIRKGE